MLDSKIVVEPDVWPADDVASATTVVSESVSAGEAGQATRSRRMESSGAGFDICRHLYAHRAGYSTRFECEAHWVITVSLRDCCAPVQVCVIP